MKQYLYKYLLVSIWLMGSVSFWGCAGRSYLMVDYQVPETTSQLSGKSVHLQFEEQRENKTVLIQHAAYKFKNFKNRYSLAYIMPDKMRIIAGEIDMPTLFKETFTKRLKSMGAEITDIPHNHTPVLSIRLERFNIDLKNNKWIANVTYQASLIKEGRPTSTERIRGNAERMKVIGRKGADTVISEIFTDAVNRLDITKLFQKAGLLP